jgi:hypothetical protein
MADDPNVQTFDPNSLQAMLSVGATTQPTMPPAGNAAPPPAPDLGSGVGQPPPQLDLGSGGSTQQAPPKQSAVPALLGMMQQQFGGQNARGYAAAPAGQPGRPISRLDAFENFLGNFLSSFATGMSNAGTGPGASGRGFGAAVQAPYQRQVQQYQMGQQAQQLQSEQQLRQAQAQLTQSQAQMAQTPWGPMPAKLAAAMMGQYVKGGQAAETAATSREDVAQTKGQFDLQKAAITAQGKAPTEIQLIGKALQGDTQAKAQLDMLQQRRMALVQERNKGLAQRPLYQLQKVLDPETGQTKFATGASILEAQQQGKNLIPAGALSQKEIISVQQLQSEASPAIKGVRDNLAAFDNGSDRTILARLIKTAGAPTYGEEASWLGNVVNQGLKENLSPEGQKELQSLGRLAETMGRLRSTLGLPATDQSMAVTLSLLPGGSTPNSKFAGGQVDQLEQMIKQAVSIPAFGGAGGGAPKPKAGGGTTSKVDSLVNKYAGAKP